jgi:hypothetical protein
MALAFGDGVDGIAVDRMVRRVSTPPVRKLWADAARLTPGEFQTSEDGASAPQIPHG